jgi:hypothetical protein
MSSQKPLVDQGEFVLRSVVYSEQTIQNKPKKRFWGAYPATTMGPSLNASIRPIYTQFGVFLG